MIASSKWAAPDRRAFLSSVGALALLPKLAAAAPPPPARNVVLVHGLFADGSSWSEVIGRLQAAGLNATAVQNPLTTLDESVAETRRVLAQQDGPTVLVGHSFAGVIVSEAGVDPKVTAVVYVAARAPDAGEDYAALAARYPTPPASSGVVFDGDEGRLSEAAFLRDFAGDLPPRRRGCSMPCRSLSTGPCSPAAPPRPPGAPSPASTQSPRRIARSTLTSSASWPKRMGAQTIELPSSHLSLISHPGEITALILQAADRPAAA